MQTDSPLVSSPVQGSFSGPSSTSRSSTKLVDDVASLTSFNPFSEEDENDQSSYTLVTSLFSRMKNTLAAPLSSAVAGSTISNANGATNGQVPEPRRPSYTTVQSTQSSSSSKVPHAERPNSLTVVPSNPAPPLVSLTPVVSEAPSFNVEYDRDRSPSRNGQYYSPVYESPDGGMFGTAIPGFPIQDDARSVRTSVSTVNRSASVSKVIRRIRGEGLSKDYWMDDENCKECYDCKSVFTTWRRKHHCRICGQIFCSRCASNIIKGSRFGHDGMVRVCNLCLEKLAKVDDDDDDDRRSLSSSAAGSFPAHQLGHDSLSFNVGRHPQSPFAASQLFGRTDEPFNLYSIAETNRHLSGSDESGFGSRPITPGGFDHSGVWEPIHESPAPFRRGLDEEKEAVSPSFNHNESPTGPGSKTPIDFPTTSPAGDGSMSSIQFPVSSPEHIALDSPVSQSMLRSRFNSYGEFEAVTPFIRSRAQSRMDSMPTEPGWRTRRESTAYAQELNFTSMHHLRMMLRQMLTIEGIPNVKEWEETLLKLALKIARELTFTALPHRQGEDMDVRRYVKIKKIPGGTPQDSEYVDGAVITKNVAHKQMSRLHKNPRIMLVTFPLEFSRVEGQYMHFGQIVRQEKEYLGNLASRIAALRPHVVLVEKSVSRLALEALAKHNIAVARTVKPSAISFVARMTQADVFSSMDKLALEPRLGHCSKFRIQTYDHALIPGRRKTYMRFEGCSRDMGCTLILRGADIDTLRRIKKVTRFLTFIVRNLKLETHMWKDSVITLRSLGTEAIPASPLSRMGPSNTLFMSLPQSASTPHLVGSSGGSRPTSNLLLTNDPVGSDDEDLPDEDAEQLRLSRRIQQSLEPYTKTFISVSATLRFPPPHPIRRMKELDDELMQVKREWEDEVVRREEKGPIVHVQEAATTHEDGNESAPSPAQETSTPELPKTPTPKDPTFPGLDDEQTYFESSALEPTSSTLTQSNGLASPMMSPTMVPEDSSMQIRTSTDIALESKLSFVKRQHEEQRRIWEWYLRKNRDDFALEKYQCISLWEYIIPIAEFGLHEPCFEPGLRYITFYGENDCTLGQFIEKSVNDTLVQFLDPKAICTGKTCNQPLARHCKVFVHNETRLFVAVEQWDGQIIGRMNYPPSPDLITTWSACRVCGSATPFIPVSEEMQRYSFAKFLELHFYPADVQLVQGAGCQHNIYQHHIRYFASRGMTVRFQADPVALNEIVYPPMRIRVRPETQLALKNSDFERLHHRNILWYTALVDDLKLISIDAATGDEEVDARVTSDINTLINRAEAEKEEVARLINRVYKESAPTDTLALNQVRSFRQDKIVAWQQDFDRLPKPRPQQAIDKSGRRTSAFNSVRAIWPRRYELSGTYDNPHVPSSSISEAEEGVLSKRKVTGDSFASSASEASDAEPEDTSHDSTEPKSSQSDTEPSPLPTAASEVPTSSATNPADESKSVTNSPTEEGTDQSLPVVPESVPKSDPDSDSTIGALRGDEPAALTVQDDSNDRPASRLSRLPRRSSNQPSVADLVQRYSDFLPPQGVEDLAKTALSPGLPASESDQESAAVPLSNVRTKHRHHHLPSKKPSTSDFEQGYAANVAPRYLSHTRRSLGQAPLNSRIPAPIGSSFESRDSSRRTSPDKRTASGRLVPEPKRGRTSPPPYAKSTAASGSKFTKGKSAIRNQTGRDKNGMRPASNVGFGGPRSTFRRPQTGPGSKVSNIAKHFEKMNRENERNNRRYNVIRGKRARPVASARAKVEILDSVKDAIMDESDSSDSSSEADDEGDGDDEAQKVTDKVTVESSPESSLDNSSTLPQASVENEPLPYAQIDRPSSDQSGLPVSTQDSDMLHPSLPLADGNREPPVSSPPSPFLSSHNQSLTPPPSDLDIGAGGSERHSILKALSGLWPQHFPPPRRQEFESDDPMSDPEHIFRESSMVVRTDEPTSIIALALNSPLYRELLSNSRAEKRTAREPKLTDNGEAFMPDDRSVAESTSTWGVVNVENGDPTNPMDELRSPSSKLPWAISFESGGLTISCTVLYPEQFDALRRTYDCEKSMIESLARCVKWDASGGKSGSAFLKTRDDRFIAKELSKPELQTMETFAPAYFDYMSAAVSANRPTLLAKVFGCYKITFKKTNPEKGPAKSKSTQMNLLVMENLFYDRRFSKIYDLKGSRRNRHVQSTGRENEVLLDENLLQTSHLAPFYLREHSKRILRGALYNDSKFLADINVMDYSLVVGVDSSNNELVVGIVDYIRTYTWDKKLESWVKESAFLGGAGKGEPTIVTPRQYRQRFISAMEQYFPLIPDRWMKQKDTPEEDTTVDP
ncbi:hypothetical protein PLICRDRAFT_50006 [Plicaturopsis crispa FD-325 SS-3]|nr:hypothetical protein PLICRDRAFT_50006 [Plicaturopsis crispa FD-325 SS-3]